MTTSSKTSRSGAKTADYGRGAALLSAGIGATGLVTFAYFFLASHNLTADEYGEISLLWSAVFVTVSVLYRPIEQLLARSVAEHQLHGESLVQPLRVAATIQIGLGLLFSALALTFRSRLQDDLLGGSEMLYWVMVGSVLAYAVSYFSRGLFAGSKRFGLYALLVFVEANSRVAFPLAVTVGIVSGQATIALGILAAPVFSLMVVPLAFVGRARVGSDLADENGATASVTVADESNPVDADTSQVAADAAYSDEVIQVEAAFDAAASTAPREEAALTFAHGGGFAVAALVIMLSEQTFLNAGPLLVRADGAAGSAALAGFVFNVLLIARAPLQLFQSVSTSLLPHLATLRASNDMGSYRHSVNVTLGVIAAFAGSIALAMLVAGPMIMEILFGDKGFEYERFGLVLIALGMGLYLCGATLNQAALAARRTGVAAACWLGCAVTFVIWMLLPVVENQVHRVESGFFGASCLLVVSLYALYQTSTPRG